jgi:hypothetical protein
MVAYYMYDNNVGGNWIWLALAACFLFFLGHSPATAQKVGQLIGVMGKKAWHQYKKLNTYYTQHTNNLGKAVFFVLVWVVIVGGASFYLYTELRHVHLWRVSWWKSLGLNLSLSLVIFLMAQIGGKALCPWIFKKA